MPETELFHYEQLVRQERGSDLRLVGIDEVGRGPLAGPVVVCGVILPAEDFFLPVNDSKSLTARQREELAKQLKEDPRIEFVLTWRSPQEIDELNILRATHQAMREAAVKLRADFALVDGLRVPDFPCSAQFIVKGDALSASIAAASILAKTYRDALMDKLHLDFPQYGFAEHKGYGTKKHLEALAKFGPCPQHRRSFAPVRQCLPDTPTLVQQTLNFS